MPDGEARVIVNARLSKGALALIDELAATEDRKRSDMIRLLLKEAVEARIKAGWRPKH